ncbi:MAG: threonine dehydratase [Proteobacteria bacterium]|nr:threonine dehydratase [Pseudomonadota bacterium]
MLPTRAALEAAAERVHAVMPPTPQYCWPLLSARVGAETWVKHENHTPIGAFKVRGGILCMTELAKSRPDVKGVITATRGNHGQSIAYGAARMGIAATIVVPHGNSVEKNAAMRGLGATLIEHGNDFQAAYEYARQAQARERLHFVSSFATELVRGVASYALEFFTAAPKLDVVYVPIGLGSGICGVIAARDALGLRTAVVGVVAAKAPCYALSYAAKRPVATETSDTFADGVAVRVPNEEAVDIIVRGAARIVELTEDEIKAAMVHYFTDTHNVAEGAGAAPLAAALKERAGLKGKRVGLILSGGNVDRGVFAQILANDAG